MIIIYFIQSPFILLKWILGSRLNFYISYYNSIDGCFNLHHNSQNIEFFLSKNYMYSNIVFNK